MYDEMIAIPTGANIIMTIITCKCVVKVRVLAW